MAKKRRPKRFSAVAAVKANARERVGTPPPERIVEDARSRAARRAARHKESIARTLARWDEA